MFRPSVAAAVCWLAAAPAVLSAPAAQDSHSVSRRADAPTATVKNGTYAGVYSPEYDQDFFLGMPYAEKAERFTVAQPLSSSWEGTRDATAYPPHCVGYGSDDIGYELSEDCLYLNVVRPSSPEGAGAAVAPAPLPVAVWIHGGGLTQGGSADARYNLSFLVGESARRGQPVLAVSLNYRLSAFGFLCGDEALAAGATNIGFRDQRLALRWVRDNIAAFGGDPDRVTIFGESSGAESMTAQVLAYNGQHDNLFQGVIGQSGFGGILHRYAGGFNATTAHQQTFRNLAGNVTSCAGVAGGEEALACLRSAPLAELHAAINETGVGPWPPVLDGDFLAGHPTEQFAGGRFAPVALLAGTNTDEGTSFGYGYGPGGAGVDTDAELREALLGILGPGAPEATGRSLDQLAGDIMALYPDDQAAGIPSLESWPELVGPDTPGVDQLGLQYRRVNAIVGDFSMHYLRRRASHVWARAGLKSWAYRFDVTVNGVEPSESASHFKEVAFVFYNLAGDGYAAPNPLGGDGAADFASLARDMSGAWISFFATGDPNSAEGGGDDGDDDTSSAPSWPAYELSSSGAAGKDLVWQVAGRGGSFVETDDYRAEGMAWFIEHALSVFGN